MKPFSKINLLKTADRVFGKALISFLKPSSMLSGASDFKKFLIIRPGGIGDAVLLIPAIQALNNIFPDAEIDILSEKRNAGVLYGNSVINDIYCYDKGLELFKIFKKKYDVVIDTEQWHRLSAVTAYFTKAPVIIGFATNEREKLFTHKIPYSHDMYEVYSFLNLIKPLIEGEPEFDPDKPFFSIGPVNDEWAKKKLKELSTGKIVGIFPGATVEERKWGIDKYSLLGNKLVKRGFNIIIIGGKEDINAGKIISKNVDVSCKNFTGKTTLLETAALLKNISAFVTSDSGLMHISYGVGTPTVSLFGAGRQKKWGPIGKKHIIINKNLSCSPCTTFGYTPKCPIGVKCLLDISVEEVEEAVLSILDAK